MRGDLRCGSGFARTRDGRLDLDFAALARPGQTIAVCVGVATLPEFAAGLVAAGLDPSMPAALIEDGGTGAARRLDGTLGSLPARAQGWASGRPALVLVGEVVALARALPAGVDQGRSKRTAIAADAITARSWLPSAGTSSPPLTALAVTTP